METRKYPEELIRKAIDGDVEARALLIYHPSIDSLLTKVSEHFSLKYKLVADDIKEVLRLKLFHGIHTLKKPEELGTWCRAVAKRYCLNSLRHSKVEKRYEDLIRAERDARRWGDKSLADLHDPQTPEELLIAKEEEVRFKERESVFKARLQEAVQRTMRTQKAELVMKAWAAGMTLSQISKETGLPLSTVQRTLMKIRKQVIRESLAEIETIREEMQSSQSMIDFEKGITRLMLEGLRVA